MSRFGVSKDVLDNARGEGIFQGIRDAWKQAILSYIRSDPASLGPEYDGLIRTTAIKRSKRQCYLITISPENVEDLTNFEEATQFFVTRKSFVDHWAYAIEKVKTHCHVHILLLYLSRSPTEIQHWAESSFRKYITSDYTIDVRCHTSLEVAFGYITKEVTPKISQKLKIYLLNKGIKHKCLEEVVVSPCPQRGLEDPVLEESQLSP